MCVIIRKKKGEEPSMKKSTRFLSVLLVVMLVMSMFAGFAAYAADVPSPAEQAAMYGHHAVAGFEGINNFRDLGGYYTADGQHQIKSGVLFRSANLHDATAADIAKLQEMGVTKIIDLRMALERLTKANKSVPGAEYIADSLLFLPNPFVITMDDFSATLKAIKSGVMETYMSNMYRQMIADPVAIHATKVFFQELIEANGAPVLWHCTSGKDRTGTEAMFLMTILGCDPEVIFQEYLNTNYFMAEKAQANYDKAYKYTHIKWIAEEFKTYELVKESWYQLEQNVLARYGGTEAYLHNVVGLSDQDFQTLRDIYLEPVAAENPVNMILPAAA